MNGSEDESKHQEGLAEEVPSGGSATGASSEIIDADSQLTEAVVTEAVVIEPTPANDGEAGPKYENGEENAILWNVAGFASL